MTVVVPPSWHACGTDVEWSDRKPYRPCFALPRIYRSYPTLTYLSTSPGGCGTPHGTFFGIDQGRHSNHSQCRAYDPETRRSA